MALAENPRARYDYEILDTLTAGLVLKGFEVKAIRSGKCSIKGSYVKIFNEDAYLVGGNIAPYQPGNVPGDYDPQATRKLLLKRSELNYLIGKSQEHGMTLVPLKVFDSHGMLKLEVGIGRGKKKYDKRAKIAERDTKRNLARAIHTKI